MAFHFLKKKNLIILAILLALGELCLVWYTNGKTGQLSSEPEVITYVAPDNSSDSATSSSATYDSSLISPTTEENLTLTDKVSRNLFAQYVYLKENGSTMDSNTQGQLVQNALQQVIVDQGRQHTVSEISVQGTESNTLIKNYGNQLGSTITAHTPKNSQNEFVLLYTMTNSNDYGKLGQLELQAKAYDAIATALLKMQVPKSAVSLHVNLINTLLAIAVDIRGLEKVQSDPLYTIGSITAYNNNLADLENVLGQYRGYFDSHAINFEKDSSGYSFTHSL